MIPGRPACRSRLAAGRAGSCRFPAPQKRRPPMASWGAGAPHPFPKRLRTWPVPPPRGHRLPTVSRRAGAPNSATDSARIGRFPAPGGVDLRWSSGDHRVASSPGPAADSVGSCRSPARKEAQTADDLPEDGASTSSPRNRRAVSAGSRLRSNAGRRWPPGGPERRTRSRTRLRIRPAPRPQGAPTADGLPESRCAELRTGLGCACRFPAPGGRRPPMTWRTPGRRTRLRVRRGPRSVPGDPGRGGSQTADDSPEGRGARFAFGFGSGVARCPAVPGAEGRRPPMICLRPGRGARLRARLRIRPVPGPRVRRPETVSRRVGALNTATDSARAGRFPAPSGRTRLRVRRGPRRVPGGTGRGRVADRR